MFSRYVSIVLGMLAVAIVGATELSAQDNSAQLREVKVVTRVLPPMVIERENALTGFSIDLMNEIANLLKLKVSPCRRPATPASSSALPQPRIQ
jgi:ABC-type amino acid transport substrate-binding protein